MKNIPVILMGCGGVGRQLLQQIISSRTFHANMGIHLRVVGVCDSTSYVLAPDVILAGFDDNFLKGLCQIKSDGLPLHNCTCEGGPSSEFMTKLTDIAARLHFVLVDCSASSETTKVIIEVLHLGCCAVLANKKPLTGSLEEFDKLFLHPRRIRHESTVGAGLPIIASTNRILSSGDKIVSSIGSLSGTLGYVMSEVENGKPFSEVVKTAKDLGYTEPDPRDDLSGMDVARKKLHRRPVALILARLRGIRLEMKDIKARIDVTLPTTYIKSPGTSSATLPLEFEFVTCSTLSLIFNSFTADVTKGYRVELFMPMFIQFYPTLALLSGLTP
ncbi:glyceraldehyde-3-phosphate dehydrogenase-like family protein [Tanacetum coccineum]